MNPINPNNQLEHLRPTVCGYVPPPPPPIERKVRLFDEITNYLKREEMRERERLREQYKPKIRRKETTVVTIKDISTGDL
jgi:hypothetical protein